MLHRRLQDMAAIIRSDIVRRWIMAISEVLDYGLRQFENQTMPTLDRDQYTPTNWSDMRTMWRRILVRMDMDTRIHKKWCAMICKGLLHHLLCRHGRAEIVMKGGQADQPVLRVTTTLSPGLTMAENEALLFRLGALIGSPDLGEDGSRLRLGCQFLLLHLQWPLWTRSPDLLLSNLLSQ